VLLADRRYKRVMVKVTWQSNVDQPLNVRQAIFITVGANLERGAYLGLRGTWRYSE
jgi:hypothetical protein